MPAIAKTIAGMARSYGRNIVIIEFSKDVLKILSCVNFRITLSEPPVHLGLI